MLTLHVATSNPGKLRDFATVADGRCTILPLPGLAAMPIPPEDELTFEGNAILKAHAYALRAPGLLVLADDSGLEVETLNGAPGVRSARYADDCAFIPPPGTSPEARNHLCLLAALAGSGATQPYPARYRCVLALAVADPASSILAIASGIVEGEILTTPRGAGGFGYDPLFYLPALGKTMAELDPATRLSVSHRGQALANLLADRIFTKKA